MDLLKKLFPISFSYVGGFVPSKSTSNKLSHPSKISFGIFVISPFISILSPLSYNPIIVPVKKFII